MYTTRNTNDALHQNDFGCFLQYKINSQSATDGPRKANNCMIVNIIYIYITSMHINMQSKNKIT
jgi:hypothetical protein